MRAERKIGEILAEMPKAIGGRPPETGRTMRPVSEPTLEEMGITKSQSSRWQTQASVPDEDFEKWLDRY